MRILIVGQRSGTTWMGEILSSTPNTKFVNEPDSNSWHANASKNELGLHPIIAPGTMPDDVSRDIRPFGKLWEEAFMLGAYEHVVAKSVAIPHCLEWVMELCHVDHVVWMKRHPLNVLASMMEFEKSRGNIGHRTLRRVAWSFAKKEVEYIRIAQQRSKVKTVNYSVLAELTIRQDTHVWRSLFESLNLPFTKESEDAIWSSLQEGNIEHSHPWHPAYTQFDHTHRSPEQLMSRDWRTRLTALEVEVLVKELGKWGIQV